MDERRNAEHYMDLTAYQAIRNVERKEKIMEYKKGEIFEYEAPYNEKRQVLIVSSDERKGDWYLNGIMLESNPKGSNVVQVICGSMQYADCDKVSLIKSENMGQYIRTASDEEMAAVDEGLLDAFGLQPPEQLDFSEPIENNVSEKMIRLECERDLYKRQYEQLFEKLIAK